MNFFENLLFDWLFKNMIISGIDNYMQTNPNKDMIIREICTYIDNHKNDIFNDYIAQYDDILNESEKIRIYIINKDKGTTDIERIVQRYNIQLCGLDREVRKLNERVESYRDIINNLQKKLNTVNNIQPISQSNDEYKFRLLNSQIKNLNEEISDIRKKVNERDSKEQFDEYKTRIETLEHTVEEQSVIIKAQKDKINTLEHNFEKLNALVKQLVNKQAVVSKEQSIKEDLTEKKSEEQYIVVKDEEQKEQLNIGFDVESIPVFNKQKETTQIDIDDFLMPKPEKQYDIKFFDIPKTDKLFLSGDFSKIKIELQKALNMDDIIEFLQQSSLENKQAYLNIFERYKKDIQKFIDKLSVDEDDEEIWGILTEKFFKIVKNNILSNFMIGIYRGMKNNKNDYESFLCEVNKYLNSCCIYTRYVHPDMKYTKNDLDDMVPLKKETSDLNKNDYIDEVERLPYYIDYLNEDGDKESFCCDGRFVVLKYEEKK